MPRVALTVQDITLTGVISAAVAATTAGSGGGWAFANTGDQCIRVRNTSGAAITVTPLVTAAPAGLTVSAAPITVAATNGDVLIGPFDPGLFNQIDGNVYVEVSAITNVVAAAHRLPPPSR